MIYAFFSVEHHVRAAGEHEVSFSWTHIEHEQQWYPSNSRFTVSYSNAIVDLYVLFRVLACDMAARHCTKLSRLALDYLRDGLLVLNKVSGSKKRLHPAATPRSTLRPQWLPMASTAVLGSQFMSIHLPKIVASWHSNAA